MNRGISSVDSPYPSHVALVKIGGVVDDFESRSMLMVLVLRRACQISVVEKVDMAGIVGMIGKVVGNIGNVFIVAYRIKRMAGSYRF